MADFKKSDLLLVLVIGEVCAWLMILISKNLAAEISFIAGIFPYLNYLLIIFPILCAIGLIAARVLSGIIPVIYQIAKFILVGGMNFLIDMAALNFLIFSTGISTGITQSAFKSVSFLIAMINSYFWNKFWIFRRVTKESTGKEFLQFIFISFIGFLINVGIDYIFVNMINPFGGASLKTWAQFSAIMAAIASLVWNFLGYKFIVFNAK